MMYININYIRFKYLKLKSQRSQKNRSIIKYKYIKFSCNSKFIAVSGGRFEYIYFFFFKKFLKKYCNSGVLKSKGRKVLFLCTSNVPLTKKAKNSRMGSGKGYFLRWSILLRKNSTIAITNNIPLMLLKRVKDTWNLSLPFKINVI